MNQKSSLREVPQFVSRVLTANNNESLRFVDGYDFKDAEFDASSISRTATSESGPQLRVFGNLLEAQQTFLSCKRAREIYEFYGTAPVGDFSDSAITHIKFQIPDYEDVEKII